MENRCAICFAVIPKDKSFCDKCEEKYCREIKAKRKPKIKTPPTKYERLFMTEEKAREYKENAVQIKLGKPSNNKCAFCLEEHPEVDRENCKPFCHECMTKHNLQLLFAQSVIEDMENQQAKADAGKPILSLVPVEIIYEIEKVRSYGVKKYKNPDNWKNVELERYHEALLRHTLAVWDDIGARDEESGLLHLSHIATNIAFILELLKDKE